jgi:hypothetical protein
MKFFVVILTFTDSGGNFYPRECTCAGETIEAILEQISEFALDVLRTEGLMLHNIVEMRRL